MRRLILLAVTALATAACGGGADPIGPVDDAADAAHGAWELAAAEPPIDVPDSARITLTIEERDGRLQAGGTAACNGYGGTLDLADGGWAMADLGATDMGCEPALMDAERAYLDALTSVDTWTRDGDTLQLSGDATTLSFQLLPEVEPAAFTGTDWVLEGFVSGTGPDATVSQTATDVPAAELRLEDDGTFTLFTGCRDFGGEWSTSGDTVVLPSWGETEDSRGVGEGGDLTCGEAAVEQELQVLSVFESGFVPQVDGSHLTIHHGEEGLAFRSADADA